MRLYQRAAAPVKQSHEQLGPLVELAGAWVGHGYKPASSTAAAAFAPRGTLSIDTPGSQFQELLKTNIDVVPHALSNGRTLVGSLPGLQPPR